MMFGGRQVGGTVGPLTFQWRSLLLIVVVVVVYASRRIKEMEQKPVDKSTSCVPLRVSGRSKWRTLPPTFRRHFASTHRETPVRVDREACATNAFGEKYGAYNIDVFITTYAMYVCKRETASLYVRYTSRLFCTFTCKLRGDRTWFVVSYYCSFLTTRALEGYTRPRRL